ncbi:hypothetical protein BX600DRAFT_418618 [Xylariales sp. PMI_506]|nr:hypothetical protein BX600DRAFT_418618 [Xylariales sp. PMI_506]
MANNSPQLTHDSSETAVPKQRKDKPFTINICCETSAAATTTDVLPASYHFHEFNGSRRRRRVASPDNRVSSFLETELSLGDLENMMKHLWFAGAKHPAMQLHLQVAIGREIVPADRMDLHLLWDKNRKLFIKPLPRFLIDLDFWNKHLLCQDNCGYLSGDAGTVCSRAGLRKVALGFLWTYACLISTETDFALANDLRLLPRITDDGETTMKWAHWKQLAREILASHDQDRVHPRFLRGELRLSRLNTIHRFTRLPPFDPYLRGWRDYSDLFGENIALITATTVYIALVLTAMQVGLATEQLSNNSAFLQASYGFTVFAILGPICALALMVVAVLFNVIKDLPWLFGNASTRQATQETV